MPRFRNNIPADFTISASAARSELIVSSPLESLVISSNAPFGDTHEEIMKDPRFQTEVSSVGTRGLEWPLEPLILSDVDLGKGSQHWESEKDLERLCLLPSAHTYLFCAKRISLLAQFCLRTQRTSPVTLVLLLGETLIISPTFRGQGSPTVVQWLTRILENMRHLKESVIRRHQLCPSQNKFLQYLATARTLRENPETVYPADASIIVSLRTGEVSYERLLTSKDVGNIDDLVGPHFGLVTALETPAAAEGMQFAYNVANVLIDPTARGGAAAISSEDARNRALFETIERYSSNRAKPTRFATIGDAKCPYDLSRLRPFSEAQYGSPDFPFRAIQSNDKIGWANGVRLKTGIGGEVPACFVTTNPVVGLPPIVPLSSNGCAVGHSQTSAIQRAILELAERDIATRSIANGTMRSVEPFALAPIECSAVSRQGGAVDLFHCDNEFRVPVFAAFYRNSKSGQGAWGRSAGQNVEHAAKHAIEEAILMYCFRSERNALLTFEEELTKLPSIDLGSLIELAPRFTDLIEHYDPFWVDLTCVESRAVGVKVASTWSPVAVDYVGPAIPFFEGVWNAGSERIARLNRILGGVR